MNEEEVKQKIFTCEVEEVYVIDSREVAEMLGKEHSYVLENE